MSCQQCDPSQTKAVFLNQNGDEFIIDSVATDGDAVSFGGIDNPQDIKVDSKGNLLIAGSPIVTSTATFRVTCEAARALWQAQTVSDFQRCGSLEIVNNCCLSHSYETAYLQNITPPNIGDSVSYFEIEFYFVVNKPVA